MQSNALMRAGGALVRRSHAVAAMAICGAALGLSEGTGPRPATAGARLAHALPADGAILAAAPTAVALRFNMPAADPAPSARATCDVRGGDAAIAPD
jgi:methionine-rich copper-binding protein CopC